jgi:hypothetical protein
MVHMQTIHSLAACALVLVPQPIGLFSSRQSMLTFTATHAGTQSTRYLRAANLCVAAVYIFDAKVTQT